MSLPPGHRDPVNQSSMLLVNSVVRCCFFLIRCLLRCYHKISIILKQTQCNSGIQMNGISFKAVALRTCRVMLTMLPMLET